MTALEKLNKNGVNLTYDDVVRICNKYQLKEISIFGSAIRDDFTDNSDVDFLISYVNIWDNSPFDLIYIKDELSELLKREIHIVEKEGLENPLRRKIILSAAEVVYAH